MTDDAQLAERLTAIFRRLACQFGPRHWWPADTPFEVCVGAILTQNTNWGNVEKAIANLKGEGFLSPAAIRALSEERLAAVIRPAGFFNVKSRRLKEFVAFLFERHAGSLERMFAGDWRLLREELLCVRGIGPETCDSILLYAGHKPTFVVDAYTKRVFSHLGIISAGASYEEVRALFMDHLPPDTQLFNEYHALIVEQAKVYCRTSPRCTGCPLAVECLSLRH
jgi:endonuclease-3 related protein